ncbi:hypothetical protein JYT28_00895, partial [Desulfobulbus sp. AH-315-M07]|nr:hypothetical protein [Desulfobulbus sp. AH-315-M07]
GLALPAAVAIFTSVGCSNPCNDLRAKCDSCGNEVYRASCRDIVLRGDNNVCAGQLPTFDFFCEEAGNGGAGGAAAACAGNETLCQGECVNLLANQKFCGSCNSPCVDPQAFCAAGSCVAEGNCPAGLPLACSGGPAGNVCVNPENDTANCGACSNACADSEVCLNGTCATSCDGLTNCDGSCANLADDPLHCGVCNYACPAGQACSDGACGDCPVGQTGCDGSCVNIQQDPANCGACGTACSATQVCSQGVCADNCATGLTECPAGSQSCVDTTSDPNNCGACDTVCSGGTPLCQASVCVAACDAGLTDCGGACVDTDINFDNCGSCGNTCNDSSVCTFDTCGTDALGECKNESGALLCSDGNICTEDKCDPIDGCTSKPLSANAILQTCKVAGVVFDENDPLELECLFCDSDSQQSPCSVVPRDDGYSCTDDVCDVARLTAPAHNPNDANCTFGCADTCSLQLTTPDVDTLDLALEAVDTTSTRGTLIGGTSGPTGCIENDTLCTAGMGNNNIQGFSCTTECDLDNAINVDDRFCLQDNAANVCLSNSCTPTCTGQEGAADIDVKGCLINQAICTVFDECCDPVTFPNSGAPVGCGTVAMGATCTP